MAAEFRQHCLGLLVLAALALTIFTLVRFGSRNADARPITTTAAQSSTTSSHVLDAAYYSVKGNLSASLTLNNKGPQPLEVQPTLFSLGGERLDLPIAVVDGNSFRVIDVRDYQLTETAFEQGSIQVSHEGMLLQLGAQIKMVDTAQSLIFDEQLYEPHFSSSRLEGVWWLPSRDAKLKLAVSNTTDSPLTLAMAVSGVNLPVDFCSGIFRGCTFNGDPSHHQATVALTLGPRETAVLDPPTHGHNGGATLTEVGGISIQHSGRPARCWPMG